VSPWQEGSCCGVANAKPDGPDPEKPNPEGAEKLGNRLRSGYVEPVKRMDELTPLPDHHTPTWMLRARCREVAPGEFFPSDGVGVDKARKVCADCPVKTECLEYALTYRIDHGVWGGCSERERRRILRARRLTARR
jgi:WhiB family redox-sensing transcriptional regulator